MAKIDQPHEPCTEKSACSCGCDCNAPIQPLPAADAAAAATEAEAETPARETPAKAASAQILIEQIRDLQAAVVQLDRSGVRVLMVAEVIAAALDLRDDRVARVAAHVPVRT